ncbi:DNA internalization-related competence protein ComEC/Rec2 [Pantoea eucrina]|uniref:DNA internalization-related competence protein ComEC/Rec2 n=1 Tax=Pantoea eucrina TaxID=472693 RepID=A0ABU5LG17_9GAMM|nr:DNA internalization-related competence protein ComEC/Rec2 [Pantoea eucrina]MDZ7278889.1 DNA internalization-related competence protein ComEC/Rec2 [Pantoea eucrina]
MQMTWILLARLMILMALPLGVLPTIPSSQTLAFMAFAAVIGGLSSRHLRIIGLAILLAVWALFEARQVLDDMDQLTARDVDVTVSISDVKHAQQQVTAQIVRVGERYLYPPRWVTLNQVATHPSLCVGQRWRMTLRMRPVHGRLNAGGFNLQRFSLANHTPLQGRILQQQVASSACGWRARFLAYHATLMGETKHVAILQALAFGQRENITEAQRQLLRDTGTAHLMAISGMHIALAAGLGWMLARGMQRLLPAKWIGHVFPLCASVAAAAVYCWISGSHAPAQRALLALMIWTSVRLAGWQLSGWHVWTLCVGGMLALDPLAVLSESFWLSALAVAMLIIVFQWFGLPKRFQTEKRWLLLRLLHLQLGMMVLMAPLQIYLFHGVSVSALLANVFAVPIVSLLTVPLILGAMLLSFPVIATPLWTLADLSLSGVLYGLALLPAGWWPVNAAIPAALVLWVGLMLWRSRLIYVTGIHCCCIALAVMLWRHAQPQDDWQIDVLDVGHGLAVAITQGEEVVLYDTGPAWTQSDAGSRIILPWLRYHHRRLHAVILSHKHLDHRGGLDAIQRALPLTPIKSALGQPDHVPCKRGQRWQWGKLTFTVLWPMENPTQGHNNDTCVIRVDDGRISLLLTGDIETEAEKKLVALEQAQLRSTFLQVPHHGSRTSSGALLLRRVAGQVAIASVARYSAWRLPNQAVIARYRAQGYAWYDTAQSGQVHIGIRAGKWQISRFREQINPRWYHQWFGVKRESR